MKKSILFCLAIVGLVSCTQVNSAGEKTCLRYGFDLLGISNFINVEYV